MNSYEQLSGLMHLRGVLLISSCHEIFNIQTVISIPALKTTGEQPEVELWLMIHSVGLAA